MTGTTLKDRREIGLVSLIQSEPWLCRLVRENLEPVFGQALGRADLHQGEGEQGNIKILMEVAKYLWATGRQSKQDPSLHAV